MDSSMIFNILVFTLFTILWLAFIAALLFRREVLSNIWQSIRSLPLLVQLLLWLLFLPVMLGLWIWQTSWPAWLRVVLVAGLAWWNVYVFFPRVPLA
jgi:ABC-type amino acid transport system permease subunit